VRICRRRPQTGSISRCTMHWMAGETRKHPCYDLHWPCAGVQVPCLINLTARCSSCSLRTTVLCKKYGANLVRFTHLANTVLVASKNNSWDGMMLPPSPSPVHHSPCLCICVNHVRHHRVSFDSIPVAARQPLHSLFQRPQRRVRAKLSQVLLL